MKTGLSISESTVGAVQVLRLGGYLDGQTFIELERKLEALFKTGRSRIVLELSGLTYIASAGVGVFINGAHSAKKNGGNVQLVNPSQSVREIFGILGLEAIFTIHPTVELGLEAAQK